MATSASFSGEAARLGFITWQFLATGFLATVVAVLVYRRFLSPLSDIPGPFAASLTRFWHVRHIWIGDQNLQQIKLHEKHGHFVRIAPNEISVSHPDGIKQILLPQLHKAKWYGIMSLPDYRYQTPMSTTNPKKKSERSRNLAPGYTMSNVIQSEDVITKTIEGFLDHVDRFAETGKPMDIDQYFTYTAFDVVGEVVFSQSFGFLREGKDIGDAIANSLELNALAAIAGYFQPLNLLFLNPISTYLKLLPTGHVFDTAMRAVERHPRNPKNRSKQLDDKDHRDIDIVSRWFRTLEQRPDHMKLRDIHAQSTTNVGAGADTVSCGLQTFVYHMLRLPGAWERARAEINAAQKERSECNGRVIAYADAAKLPYVQACIKEALRIFGPVPMGLPRVAGKGGVTIGDRTFPEGTILSINPWVMHYSKEIWGPDAAEFRPDRWLEGDTTTLDRYWIPFGVGYNSCPGQNVAKIQLSKILATLVRDYDIRQVNPKQNWTWRAFFTVVPHDWPVYITKRPLEVSR